MSGEPMPGGEMDPVHDNARLAEIAALGMTAAEVDVQTYYTATFVAKG